MSRISKFQKPKIISDNQIHSTDTGSSEVQIAVLSSDIKNLTVHLQANPKDFGTRRSLLKKVGTRRRLLKYLFSEDKDRYLKVCKKHGIKPSSIAFGAI
jgi:small subunit ribosomal protein S15